MGGEQNRNILNIEKYRLFTAPALDLLTAVSAIHAPRINSKPMLLEYDNGIEVFFRSRRKVLP
jgi:hypothetical protein